MEKRFIIANAILSMVDKFSIEDVNNLINKWGYTYPDEEVKDVILDFRENGLLFEIGMKYKLNHIKLC